MFDLVPMLALLSPRTNMKSPHWRAAKHLKNDFKAWYDLLERLQIDKDSLLVPSVTSCSARDVMVGAQNKERFTITTSGLLMLCCCAWAHRSVSDNKVAGKTLLEGLVSTCLPGVGVADVELDPMLSCHSSKCQNTRVNGSCLHWKMVVREMDKADTEFEKLLQLLHVTCSLAFECQCVLNVFKELVETMQAAICQEWDTRDFPTDPIKHSRPLMGASKKRLVDGNLKEEIMKRAASRKISPATVASVALGSDAPGNSHEWTLSRASAYMAACYRAFDGDDDITVWAMCYDAARLGRPLEETLLMALFDGEQACWMAPMVPTHKPMLT